MKAAYIERQGGPEVFRFGDLPDPVAGSGQLVVDIHTASVNGADWKVRSGSYSPLDQFPYVLGRDFSGVVSAVGPEAADFAVGDAVFAVCDVGQEGTYAEKIAINADLVARKPDAISHMEAAAVALIGLTALVSVEDTLELKSGETILITGGAGGVAGFAVQLAKHTGATVITTTSAKNMDYVRRIGADQVIDYGSQDFADIVADCDAVFDTVGGDVTEACFRVLRPGGRAAFIASGASAPDALRPDVTALRPKVGRDRPHLQRIIELLEMGAVTVPPITAYPLAEAAAAHRISEARHLRGKLVLTVR